MVYARLCAARDDLFWTRYERDPVALPSAECEEEELDSRELVERARELRDHMMELEFLHEVPTLAGRELDPRQRDAIRRRLVVGAVVLRRLAHVPAATTLPGSDVKLRHMIVAVHARHRSLVLAISAHEDWRALTGPVAGRPSASRSNEA